jgi:hypothetical protein
MNNCSEFVLDDLLAVTAIPVSDYDPGTAAWQLRTTIDEGDFSPILDNAIAIGMQPATAGGTLIPIRRSSGKAKDAESDSVAGRLHSVSVSCEVDDRDSATWDSLLALERTPSHLLLTFRGGQRAFAYATEDTYACEVERSGAKTSVSIKVQNLMGIQLITTA